MFYFEHFIPHVKFAADYKFDGKIFVVPMQGQGKAEINLCKYYNLFPYKLRYYTILLFFMI